MKKDSISRELEHRLNSSLDGEVRFDTTSRLLYSTDASNFQVEPVGVVIPKSSDDLCCAVQTASELGVPVLARGGGTSLAGQAVGSALVIDCSKYLNSIISIDAENMTVTTEPGIYLEQLNRQLKLHGLMFGPDPSTARIATVGGVIGNNSTGAHSILYGMAGDNVKSCRLITIGGRYNDLVEISEQRLLSSRHDGDDADRLLHRLLGIRNDYGKSIKQDFPRHWRRASGYSLNYLLDTPLNPARLLAGSEGTLGVVGEFTLNLVPVPARTGLVILQSAEIAAAMDAVSVILQKEPSAIELIDRMLIDLTRSHPGYAPLLSFIKDSPEAVLVVEFSGDTETDVEKKCRSLKSHLQANKVRCDIQLALGAEDQSRVWQVRRAGLGLLMSSRDAYKPIPCIEDVSVPVDMLPSYVRDITSAMDSAGCRAAFYGHASAGCLHIRPLINLKGENGPVVMKDLTEIALELAMKYGGVLSGEHGDGLQRSYLNEKLFGSTLYAAMKELKSAFDPEGIFNPGKVVDGRFYAGSLRYAENYQERKIRTHLDWSHEGGLAAAAEQCSGQGVCRKLGEGVMCPSYIATRDERDTTRARANMLRAVATGRLSGSGMNSHQMYEVYDLCLSCKACASECPSGVDASKMKTEFMAHYKSAHGFTMRDRIFGMVHDFSLVGATAPSIANYFLKSIFFSPFIYNTCITQKRTLPLLSSFKFADWFNGRPSPVNKGGAIRVVYFHDTWASFYKPEVGIAAVSLLEAAGYKVILVKDRVCCGRPMLSQGMIDYAKANAQKNIDVLGEYVRQGIPIIGTEPSCILAFRDEYPYLVAKKNDALLLAENSYLLEEFLFNRFNKDDIKLKWKKDEQKIFYHVHCHERAAIGNEASLGLLQIAGCRVTESGAGCCGMAGSFGYEKEHYEISKAVGEDRLFPAVRNLPDDTVVAVSGFSCTHQIEHFTGRKPVHVAEVLADRLAD